MHNTSHLNIHGPPDNKTEYFHISLFMTKSSRLCLLLSYWFSFLMQVINQVKSIKVLNNYL